jgi:hypothetical protein
MILGPDSNRLAGIEARDERGSGKTRFEKMDGERGNPTLTIRNVITDAKRFTHRDSLRCASPDLKPAYGLLREPSRKGNESEHGSQKQVKQIVARIDRSEADRERTRREHRSTDSEADATPRP